MKILTNFFFLTLSFIITSSIDSFGQTVSKNKAGELIVVFDDGSWRYYEAGDSILIKKEVIAAETSNDVENVDNNSSEIKNESKPPKQSKKTDKKSEKSNKQNTGEEKVSKKKTAIRNVVVKDLLLDPPPYNCSVAFTGIDEYTKKRRVELQKEVLFDFSDPEVAVYLKGRSYVTCEANFVEFIGDIRILSFKITVASRMARADYGYLNSNTLMSIKLLNGETITLFSNNSDVGQIDNDNNLTVYKATFPVTRENQKTLTSSLIDKIKIVWSTGYEEYPVSNVDFFVNQIKCLDNQ